MKQQRAIIIGGSLGGLCAANLLRTIGWDVDVFERVEDDLADRGAGIVIHDEMFTIMRRIGLGMDETYGVEVRTRCILDKSGEIIKELVAPRLMSAWARIYRPLKDYFPEDKYHYGKSLEAIEQNTDGVTATFADGSSCRADLLIGADGVRSTVRSLIFPDAQLRYAGYIAWRGMVEEAQFPPRSHAQLFERHCYGSPEGEFITIYPVPGKDNDIRKGYRRSNWVWHHPVDFHVTLRDLCTDADGRYHGNGIAPQLIRRDAIAQMRSLARRVFAPQIAELIEITEQPFFQAIFDLESPRVFSGRVALLGDAAFVARPHLAMGTTKAALDAGFLCDAIAAEPDRLERALARYDEPVRKFGTRLVARGRWLGAHLEAQVTKPREQRSAHELHHMPHDVLLREFSARLEDIPELAEVVAMHSENKTA